MFLNTRFLIYTKQNCVNTINVFTYIMNIFGDSFEEDWDYLIDPNITSDKKEHELSPINLKPFDDAFENMDLILDPYSIGFIPSDDWKNKRMTFHQIVINFFRKKNSSKCLFIYKLYNALRLSEINPEFTYICGVSWWNKTSIRVFPIIFAKLLGIKAIDGSLFHKQGNFTTHGFIEVEPTLVKKMIPNFDFTCERLLCHSNNLFVQGCNEKDLLCCKWRNSTKNLPINEKHINS